MPFFTSDNSHRYPKELFDNTVYLPFENTYISAPARYDEVLNIEYGDFMRVSKEWIFHNYPVYREQERILKNNIGRNPYRYTIDDKALLTSIKRYSLSVLAPPKKKDKEIIVFLPCWACWWETMEKLLKEYSQDDEKEVHVIPIFYYDCDYKGIVKDKHDEKTLY